MSENSNNQPLSPLSLEPLGRSNSSSFSSSLGEEQELQSQQPHPPPHPPPLQHLGQSVDLLGLGVQDYPQLVAGPTAAALQPLSKADFYDPDRIKNNDELVKDLDRLGDNTTSSSDAMPEAGDYKPARAAETRARGAGPNATVQSMGTTRAPGHPNHPSSFNVTPEAVSRNRRDFFARIIRETRPAPYPQASTGDPSNMLSSTYPLINVTMNGPFASTTAPPLQIDPMIPTLPAAAASPTTLQDIAAKGSSESDDDELESPAKRHATSATMSYSGHVSTLRRLPGSSAIPSQISASASVSASVAVSRPPSDMSSEDSRLDQHRQSGQSTQQQSSTWTAHAQAPKRKRGK